MAVHIDNPRFAAPPSGFIPSGAGQSIAKRACFLDYFPNVKENYKGYIAQSIFEGKMKAAIRQAVESAGRLSTRFGRLPERPNLIVVPSNFAIKSELNIDQSGLDRMTKESSIRDYYESIRTELLHRVWGEQWRTSNETNMSGDMYAQSNNYALSAVKDVGIYAVSLGAGKAIGSISKKLKVKTVRQFRDRIPNTGFSVTGNAQTIGDSTYNYTAKASLTLKDSNLARNISFKGIGPKTKASVTLAEFNTLEKGFEEITDTVIGNSDFESFNCFDFRAKSKWGQNLNAAADVVTDFIPLISVPKLVVNTAYNTLLSFQTRATAKRMKDLEDRSNEAERNFNQKLKQSIYNDVNALSYIDIKHLIDEIGLTVLTI